MTKTSLKNKELDISTSTDEHNRAKAVIPGGLVSLVRRRDHQVVFERGEGAYLWDVDGNRYIDCVMAHGPVLLGHAHPEINRAAARSLDNGIQFGGSTPGETALAEAVLKQLGYADKVTFMTTGTEAVQLAIRVARTTTGRNLIVKFHGHYHGWIDPVYVNIPGYDVQGPSTQDGAGGAPGSLAIQPAVDGSAIPEGILVTTWNDLDGFARLMDEIGDRTAAVIMEPFLTGFGTFEPAPGYLQGLKDICHDHGALVIYDEIVTGFRVSPSGAAGIVGVSPDLGTYAKAMGNGFPISMVAGTQEAMACLEDGTVPAAGTYSGTPASVAAARATLAEIAEEGPSFYAYLDRIGSQLRQGLEQEGQSRSISIRVNQIGSLVQILCGLIEDPRSVEGAYASDRDFVTEICEAMIGRGIYMTRKGLIFLSRAHTTADIQEIVSVFGKALDSVQRGA
ncbi:aspartate aminotransferase family protein [Paenarthrobacter sp. 2TAF44]|uniref:aspartate aminotransferase family protein n=1 Tax=Paenarthrobacter sp. 2TAF44 TaxID=3233018 RepID=UPI003F97D373